MSEIRDMSIVINKLFNKTYPLCFTDNGTLICYRYGELLVLRDRLITKKIYLPINKKEKFLYWSKFALRFFRFGVRAAIALDNEHIILSYSNKIYEVDLQKEWVSSGWSCGEGIRPLIFTEVQGIKSFNNGIYFGGYLGNVEKHPVNIYYRVGIDQWEIAYTFPQGTINHVHNIVADPYRNCLWVFTGDFDKASAIWKISDNFNKVERVLCNDQKYRGCVAFALPEGMLYATDAPFDDDYIYLMTPDTLDVKVICPIHGSCIYGCKWKDKYVFSSTVEGDGRNTPKMEFLFGRKRGAGIKDDYVHMYIGNLKEGFKEVFKDKKDNLPYYTFQFGVFKFPAGINNSNTLYFQPVATKQYDLDLIYLT